MGRITSQYTKKEEAIRILIDSVVNKHVKGIWPTPYFEKRYIPNEELWSLKEDLYTMIKYILEKGGEELHGKAKKS